VGVDGDAIRADDVLRSVAAVAETPPSFDDKAGGKANADDPAIWLHPTDSSKSLIFGTKKNAGLGVYDLLGRELQSIKPPAAPGPDDEPGRFNNVDVLYDVTIGSRSVDIAVVTDRGRDQLRFFAIDSMAAAAGGAPLTDITAPDAPFVFSADQAEANGQANAYGLAVSKRKKHGPAFAFATRRHRTAIATLAIVPTAAGLLTYRRIATLTLPQAFALPDGTSWSPCESSDDELPQAEGMVFDDERKILFVAQEDVGIWRVRLEDLGDEHDDDPPEMRLVDRVREFGVPFDRTFDPIEGEFVCTVRFDRDPGFAGKHLSADAEGLTIYRAGDEKGYLLASSQGDSTFVVYDRRDRNEFVGAFQIVDGRTTDGVQHSDGATVLNVSLGSAFPRGVFVAHDGENAPDVVGDDGTVRENTNFKLVPWPAIAGAFAHSLKIDPKGFDPRER
jgi:3-phytase